MDENSLSQLLTKYGLKHLPFTQQDGELPELCSYKRRQQVRYIQHLCRFTQQILLVHGPHGVGKSTLRKHLLKELYEKREFTVFQCSSEHYIDFALLVRTLAKQFGLTNQPNLSTETLSDALMQLPSTLKQGILVIDDAENMTLQMLEAIILIGLSPSNRGRLHVVVFGNDEIIEKLRQIEIYRNHIEAFHDISIWPFTQQETERFISQAFEEAGSHQHPFDQKQLQMITRMSGGNPALIADATANILTNPKAFKQQNRRPKNWLGGAAIGLGAITLMVLAVTFSFMNDDSLEPQQTQSLDDDLIIKEVFATAPTDTTDKTLPEISEPFIPLKPDDQPNETKRTQTAEKPVTANTKSVDKEKAETRIPATEKVIANEAQPQTTISTTTVSHRLTVEAFLQRDPKHYVTQLFGSWHEQEAIEFIESHKIHEVAKVLATHREDQPWYIVVMGDYPSRADAKKDLAGFPKSIKEHKPWIRTIGGVHTLLPSKNTS